MPARSNTKTENVLKAVREQPSTRVRVAVSDIEGVLRGKYMHKEKFLSAADGGFGFCNVIFGWDANDAPYDNTVYTGWHTGYPDAAAQIDLGTYRRMPWDDDVAFFLADFVDDRGAPLAVCPRQVLKRAIAELDKAGYKSLFGLEYEWFNFRETPQSLAAKRYTQPEPLSPGMFGYSLIRAGQQQPYFKALTEELAAFGIPLEGLHTETGPGVFEAAIVYTDALEAADRGILFKLAVKEIAQRFGIMPSFMAKWSMQYPGCSGHCHQSLTDGRKNLFYDERDPQRMSKHFRSWVAGQLACIPEILPMFAPTINSYKRLVDGYWAPVKPTWGIDNRTVSLRVIPGSAKSTRLETRQGGADMNAYLAVAACIAAGLYGVRKRLKLSEAPVTGTNARTDHIPRLPRTLIEATERMKRSEIARELFGEAFVDHFVRTREWEWRQYLDAVTDWELKRYFEIV
jgi:glutamine synthetase